VVGIAAKQGALRNFEVLMAYRRLGLADEYKGHIGGGKICLAVLSYKLYIFQGGEGASVRGGH